MRETWSAVACATWAGRQIAPRAIFGHFSGVVMTSLAHIIPRPGASAGVSVSFSLRSLITLPPRSTGLSLAAQRRRRRRDKEEEELDKEEEESKKMEELEQEEE